MDNFENNLRFYRDDGPNYMRRSIQAVSPAEFHENPDYYTEKNERLEDSIKTEERRQEFHNIVATQFLDVQQIFKAIVNNRTKE